ncbi:MAG: CPBP family intramembrane metalloprotease [Verrucomicrobiales bacterium]|nr:CPBP family intramembrane metalloprotease [Verrucomicrobiales bacterium]
MVSPSAPPELPPPLPHIHHAGWGSGIAWLVLLAGMALAIGSHFRRQANAAAKPASGVDVPFEMMARYVVGAASLPGMKAGSPQMEQLLKQAQTAAGARGPSSEFRGELLRSYLSATWPADETMQRLVQRDASLRDDWQTVQALRDGHCRAEDWESFHHRHGWVAKLPRALALPAGDSFAKDIADDATRTLMVVGGGGLLAMAAAVGGLVVLIVWLVGVKKGRHVPVFYGVAPGMGAPFLEGMAWYFAGMILIPSALVHWIGAQWPWWAKLAPGVVGVLTGFLWPRWRGIPREVWKHVAGWHLGRGFWREAGCGALGWLASLPVLAAGIILTNYLMKASGETVSHPIYEWLGGSRGMKWLAFLLAVLWAPVTEEMMFRGLLFPGISARLPWWAAALLSSFIFAAIHPQGWLGLPVLMVIAMMLSILRRWRGSLVAPMTAHACNNGTLLLLFLLAV